MITSVFDSLRRHNDCTDNFRAHYDFGYQVDDCGACAHSLAGMSLATRKLLFFFIPGLTLKFQECAEIRGTSLSVVSEPYFPPQVVMKDASNGRELPCSPQSVRTAAPILTSSTDYIPNAAPEFSSWSYEVIKVSLVI